MEKREIFSILIFKSFYLGHNYCSYTIPSREARTTADLPPFLATMRFGQ